MYSCVYIYIYTRSHTATRGEKGGGGATVREIRDDRKSFLRIPCIPRRPRDEMKKGLDSKGEKGEERREEERQ